MSWSIRQRWYLDLSQKGNKVLLDVEDNGVADRTKDLVQRLADCFDLELMFIDRAIDDAIVALPETYAIILAGKLSTNGVVSGDVLFSATGFVPFDDAGDTGYRAALDLNTTELETALGDNASIDVQVDVEIQNGDNTRRITLSFVVKVMPQSYAGEGSPTPAEPVYPAPENIITISDIELPAGKKLVFAADGTYALEDAP